MKFTRSEYYKESISKYILQNDVSKKISDKVKGYEESRLEFFKELGEEKDGMFIVSPEKQEELFNKIQELESVEVNIEVPKLNVGELYNIETEDYWPVLLDKLLAKEETKAEPKVDDAPKSEAPVVPL